MTENIKVGKGVVGVTVFDGRMVMAPLHKENLTKSERIARQDGNPRATQAEMTALVEGMFELWGGKVDTGELLEVAFGREFREETAKEGHPDIILAPEQMIGKPTLAGQIEQLRGADGKVLFWVFALPLVDLTWDQMNELSKRQEPGKDLLEVNLNSLPNFLQTESQKIRPATLLAAQSVLAKPINTPFVMPVPATFATQSSAFRS